MNRLSYFTIFQSRDAFSESLNRFEGGPPTLQSMMAMFSSMRPQGPAAWSHDTIGHISASRTAPDTTYNAPAAANLSVASSTEEAEVVHSDSGPHDSVTQDPDI